ncbi:MAG TPA: hypothetical protein DDY13_10015 [Cytophagales bacterium]|nr:hypothetical protein [Cytophagales bacterium]
MLFMEFIQIGWWFNPVVYLFKKQLCTLHEYLADKHVRQTMNDEGYISLLAKQWLSVAQLNIGNHFSKSQTIKRMNMMKTKPKKASLLKVLAVIASVPIAFYFVSCQSNDETVSAAEVVEIEEIGGEVLSGDKLKDHPLHPDYLNLKAENPDGEYNIATFFPEEGNQQQVKSEIRELNNWSLQLIKSENNASLTKVSAILQKINPELARNQMGKTDQDNDIFTEVEDAPQPIGGFQVFYEELTSKLKYPEEAKNNGIEGKVFVEFIVEKDGSLTYANVKKGIGYGCDEAALNAFEGLKKWNPGLKDGKPVRVRMILPISFRTP